VTELVVVLSLLLAVSAFAVPSFLHSWRTYELNSAATQIANMLKFTRSEAIRLNSTENCLMVQRAGVWYVGADQDGNGTLDAGERQIILSNPSIVDPSGAPDPASMGYPTLPQNFLPSITFNSRGSINNPPAIYVIYVGEVGEPQYGFRAVTLMPSGSTRVWTAPGGGTWSSIN